MQLPPPIHGASIMNSLVVNSEKIKREFIVGVINLQFAKSIKDISHFSTLKVLKSFTYGLEIYKKIKLFKPDLIYFTLSPVGYAFFRDVFYVSLMKMMHSKIVYHLHGKGIKKNSKKSTFKKYLYKNVFKNENIICLSKSLKADLENVSNSVPYIVPNGIQTPKDSANYTHPYNDNTNQILFLSNYMRTKGVLDLMYALNILNKQGFRFNARFVGAPFDLSIEFLENLAHKYELSEIVSVTGPLYGDQKIKEFQKADIFVFPTYYENEAFPLVLLEAMQYRLPVISTFEGGIPDIIIDGETGFLVEAQNCEMLAGKIAILLKDKKLCIKMGENGYDRFINNYTSIHFENNLYKTFQSILGLNHSLTT